MFLGYFSRSWLATLRASFPPSVPRATFFGAARPLSRKKGGEREEDIRADNLDLKPRDDRAKREWHRRCSADKSVGQSVSQSRVLCAVRENVLSLARSLAVPRSAGVHQRNVTGGRYNARRRAGSRAAPQESSGRVSTFRFYSLVGRSAAPLRVKFVALRCARRRVRGALSRGVHHRAFDCASPHLISSHRNADFPSTCDTKRRDRTRLRERGKTRLLRLLFSRIPNRLRLTVTVFDDSFRDCFPMPVPFPFSRCRRANAGKRSCFVATGVEKRR